LNEESARSSGTATEGNPIPALRTGGVAQAGRPYLVGDRPGGRVGRDTEVFVPGVTGRVLANRELNRAIRENMTRTYSSPFMDTVMSGNAPRVTNASSSNSNGELLRAIQGLRKDLKNLPATTHIDRLMMPQTYQLDRSDRQNAKVFADWERNFMRGLKSDRRNRY
ncbi:MAG: hypothetical protein AAFR31_19000, partial [Cyanobacteria bacterium J06627_8]